MLYNRPTKGQSKSRRGIGSSAEEETAYEPNWAFLLDDEGNVVRFSNKLAYIVSKDAEGETEFEYGGAEFGDSIDVDDYRKVTIEDIASEVTKLVGKDNVTSAFYSNGSKLVYTGSKIAKDVDQLCMTICNDLWIDVVLTTGGDNNPKDIVTQFGNLFFYVRIVANTFGFGGTPRTNMKDFLEDVKAKFEEIQKRQKKSKK